MTTSKLPQGSEAVQHYGIPAKPLEPHRELKPKKINFLIELSKFTEEKKWFLNGHNLVLYTMSAKDRLECLSYLIESYIR